MKSVIFSTAFALLAAVAQTAPAPAEALEARVFYVGVTFYGVGPDDYYTQSFPANGQPVPIDNDKSVSKISNAGGGDCSFTGIDGSETFVLAGEEKDVGPPQVQISGVCDIA